jgi:hypothetical protein
VFRKGRAENKNRQCAGRIYSYRNGTAASFSMLDMRSSSPIFLIENAATGFHCHQSRISAMRCFWWSGLVM